MCNYNTYSPATIANVPRLPNKEESAIKKLKRQTGDVLHAAVFDIDGTLYTSVTPLDIIHSAAIDRALNGKLAEKNIPIIFDTSEVFPEWKRIWLHSRLLGLGLPEPDAVIYQFGTSIKRQQSDGSLQTDSIWQKKIEDCPVKLTGKEQTTWGEGGKEFKATLAKPVVETYQATIGIAPKHIKTDETFVVSFATATIPVEKLEQFVHGLRKSFQKGIKVVYSENLFKENTLSHFSGTIALLPDIAGKDGAAWYLLEDYARILGLDSQKEKQLAVQVFGDSMGDKELLTTNPDLQSVNTYSHAVNASALLKEILREQYQAYIVGRETDITQLRGEIGSVPLIHEISSPQSIYSIIDSLNICHS